MASVVEAPRLAAEALLFAASVGRLVAEARLFVASVGRSVAEARPIGSAFLSDPVASLEAMSVDSAASPVASAVEALLFAASVGRLVAEARLFVASVGRSVAEARPIGSAFLSDPVASLEAMSVDWAASPVASVVEAPRLVAEARLFVASVGRSVAEARPIGSAFLSDPVASRAAMSVDWAASLVASVVEAPHLAAEARPFVASVGRLVAEAPPIGSAFLADLVPSLEAMSADWAASPVASVVEAPRLVAEARPIGSTFLPDLVASLEATRCVDPGCED